MKSNKPMIDAVTWTNVGNIAISERSKPQETTYCMVPVR